MKAIGLVHQVIVYMSVGESIRLRVIPELS